MGAAAAARRGACAARCVAARACRAACAVWLLAVAAAHSSGPECSGCVCAAQAATFPLGGTAFAVRSPAASRRLLTRTRHAAAPPPRAGRSVATVAPRPAARTRFRRCVRCATFGPTSLAAPRCAHAPAPPAAWRRRADGGRGHDGHAGGQQSVRGLSAHCRRRGNGSPIHRRSILRRYRPHRQEQQRQRHIHAHTAGGHKQRHCLGSSTGVYVHVVRC